MPVGIREAVGGAVSVIAVDPALPAPGRVDRPDDPVERSWFHARIARCASPVEAASDSFRL